MEIKYENIFIRNLKFQDLKYIKEIRDYCLEFLDTQISYSYEETCDWFIKQNPKWYVIEIEENKIIGYIRTSDYDEVNKCFFVGIDLHPDFRNKGYAFKSYQIFLNYMKTKGYVLSYLKVQISNYKAYNLYKKLGFIPVGIIANAIIKENQRVDSIFMYKNLLT